MSLMIAEIHVLLASFNDTIININLFKSCCSYITTNALKEYSSDVQ